MKGLGKHSVPAPLLKQTLGQCLTCFPPFWGKEGFFLKLFLRGEFAPSDVPNFVCSSFSLVLHLLGIPEFAALCPSPTARVKYKEGSLSYLLPCTHRVVSPHWDPSFNFQILAWAFAALFLYCHLQEDVFSSVFMGLDLRVKKFNKHRNKDTVKVREKKKTPHTEPKDVHSFGYVLKRPLHFCARGNDCF